MDNGSLTQKPKLNFENTKLEIICYNINKTHIEIILNNDIILKI